MDKIENGFDKEYSPNPIFKYKNHFQEDLIESWTMKFTLKAENFKF